MFVFASNVGMCVIPSAPLKKSQRGRKKRSISDSRKKKRQKVPVHLLEYNRLQLPGTGEQIMNILGEKSKGIQQPSNTDVFHSSQIVHCIPAAFCIESNS